MKFYQLIIRQIVGFVLLILFIILFLGSIKIIFGIEDFLLPRLETITKTLVLKNSLILSHLIVTSIEILVGMIFGSIFAVFVTILSRKSVIRSFATYMFIINESIPKILLAPLFIIWLGYGILPKIILVSIAVALPLYINLCHSIDNIYREFGDLIRTNEHNPVYSFYYIVFPLSLPYFVKGLKIAFPAAVVCSIISEWFGAINGIGYLIQIASRNMNTPFLVSIIIIVSFYTGMITLILNTIYKWLYDRTY